VDALDENGAFVNGLDAEVSVVGPAGEATRVKLAQTAPGHYEGVFVPQAEGAYLMRLAGSLAEKQVLALTTGWVMGYSPEYAALEGDPAYLARLAELGGGTALERPAEAFAHTLRGTGTTRDLWPYLLGLAAILLPFDVGVRRLALGRREWEQAWGAARGWLSREGREGREGGLAPVGRLFQAKSRAGERRAQSDVAPEAAPPPVREPVAPAPPLVAPTPTPAASSLTGGDREKRAAEVGTLAGRLLKRKQERRGDDE